MSDVKLTTKERWKANTEARRKRLTEAGGRNIAMTLSPGDAQLLDEILAHRRKTDPKVSIAKWIAKMIQRDHSEMKRVRRRGPATARPAKAGGHSTALSTP